MENSPAPRPGGDVPGGGPFPCSSPGNAPVFRFRAHQEPPHPTPKHGPWVYGNVHLLTKKVAQTFPRPGAVPSPKNTHSFSREFLPVFRRLFSPFALTFFLLFPTMKVFFGTSGPFFWWDAAASLRSLFLSSCTTGVSRRSFLLFRCPFGGSRSAFSPLSGAFLWKGPLFSSPGRGPGRCGFAAILPPFFAGICGKSQNSSLPPPPLLTSGPGGSRLYADN